MQACYGHEDILLNGSIIGSQNKNINLDFKNVDLVKVTPTIENLKLGGNLNGQLNISQLESIYLPTTFAKKIPKCSLQNYTLMLLY